MFASHAPLYVILSEQRESKFCQLVGKTEGRSPDGIL